jgi:hypothetical protein
MSGTSDVFRASAILEGKDSLRNHLACIRTDDMYSQDAVSFLFRNELDRAIRVEIGFGTRVGREGEAADGVLDAGSF